jgi:hypothetical protein
MAAKKYLLDLPLIRAELDRRRWLRKQLADASTVGSRTLTTIFNGHAVTYDVASLLARALGCSVFALTEKHLHVGSTWLDVPDLDAAHERLLIEALQHDMHGRHAQAAKLCRRILRELPDLDDERRTFVRLKMAIFMDNGGDHVGALALLEAMVRDDSLRSCVPGRLFFWAEYHRALCFRRLRRLNEAESAFLVLLKDAMPHALACVKHQLGVVYLKSAKKEGPALVRAIRYLRASRDIWQRAGNHREGFSLRRLAEADRVRGLPAKAVEWHARALAVFAVHGCARYVEETVAALVQLARRNFNGRDRGRA